MFQNSIISVAVPVHQREPAEHLRAGRDRAGVREGRAHRRRRLQVGPDQAQVRPRRLPRRRRHQAQVHRQLQPPREQRRKEPQRTGTVQVLRTPDNTYKWLKVSKI